MANTPPRQQDAPATSPPLPGPGAVADGESFSAVATAVAVAHSASVVLVHHHHAASEQLLSRHGTGFILWSSAAAAAAEEEDYLVLTANHVITLDEHEQNDGVEIVVKMPGSDDYLPATPLRIDAHRDIALLRVRSNNNDGKTKTARPALTLDGRIPPPVGTVVVLLGYFAVALDGDADTDTDDADGEGLLWPDVPGPSPGKITSDAFASGGWGIDNWLDEKIKANCASTEGCAGSPLIVDHRVVGMLTGGDVYATIPTLKAVFQLWLGLQETDQRTANDLIPLLAAL